MGVTENILTSQLECDYYEGKKPDFLAGLAQKAIDNGFEFLSDAQQRVLAPHLSQPCNGVENPGGYHNNCQNVLDGDELVSAYQSQMYYDGLLCQDCQNEASQYIAEWERIEQE